MGLTVARQVTSGFFRVHLWVLLGVQTLAAFAIYSGLPGEASVAQTIWGWQLALAIGAAAIGYIGSVIWMYEQSWLGKLSIWVVAALALAGCLAPVLLAGMKPMMFQVADRAASGGVL